MKSKTKIRDWILENCVDKYGDIRLDYLPFGDFNGDVYIGNMKVKKNLHQSYQEVGEYLFQSYQEVGGYLYQDSQKVGGYLYQRSQEVGGDLFQGDQKVGGYLYQRNQKVGVSLWEDKLINGKTKEQAMKELEELYG